MNVEKVKQGPQCILLGLRRGRWHHITWAEGLNLSGGPSRWSFRWIGRKPQCAAMQAGRVFLIGWRWVVNLPIPPTTTERSLWLLGSGVGVGTVTVWANRMW